MYLLLERQGIRLEYTQNNTEKGAFKLMENSKSDRYAAAGVDITAGYKAVELMKAHVKRTTIPGADTAIGGFG